MRRDMRRFDWFRRFEEIVFRVVGIVVLGWLAYEGLMWLLG